MKLVLLFAILAHACQVAFAAPATQPATTTSVYHAYWLTETAPHGEYVDLLISKEPIPRLAEVLPDASATVVTTYAKDSIWNRDGHPFRPVESFKMVDDAKQMASMNGKEYRLETAPLRDVVALLEKPNGTLPVHRIRPPLAGAEDSTKQLLARLKDQLSAEAVNASPVVVELHLTHAKANDGSPCVEPSLTIRNSGAEPLLVQQLTNRQAIMFFVTDELGNVVAPQLRGKSDPAFEEVELRPGTEMKHTFETLDFVTGSAWMGYDLKMGETYRVVALYRPSGIKGPGFCSKEETLALK